MLSHVAATTDRDELGNAGTYTWLPGGIHTRSGNACHCAGVASIEKSSSSRLCNHEVTMQARGRSELPPRGAQ
jgi:hypothetical protein